jgi:tetratricopeptide (TPR) repeat protein
VPPPPDKPDDDPKNVYLREASYSVKGEKDGLLEVLITDGTIARVETRDLVSLNDAVEFFSTRLKDAATDSFALLSRGWAHYLLAAPAKAVKDFTEFLRLNPPDATPPLNVSQRWEGLVERGLVYAEQGEFEKALKDFQEVIQNLPTNQYVWINRGFAHGLMGEYQKAIEDCDRAIDNAPENLLPKNNKAWVLATCPDEKVRNAAKAIQLAKDVCTATRNQEGMYVDTLAAAYATAGKFDDAIKMQDKALEDTSFVARYGIGGQQRRQLYIDKKPYQIEPVKKR